MRYLLLSLLSFLSFISLSYGRSDTLIICAGESIQLETTPGQISYLWTPEDEVSNATIFNPSVSPEETQTYYVRGEPIQDINLVFNGDFSSGNSGFTTDYILTTVPTFAQGHYAIFTNPQQFNADFGDCRDHTPSGDGLMFVADGATIPNERVWCQEIDVVPGRTYDFSAWICNVHPTAPSRLQFSINGDLLGDVLDVQSAVCDWQEFVADWYSDNFTRAEICITNQSTIAIGNDFAIDDINFTLNESFYIDTFTVVVLETSNTELETSICANESFSFNGQSVAAGTQMDFNFVGANGCDSIISLTVNAIDTSLRQTVLDTFCLGETVLYRGAPISRDTVICEIYTNAVGCDSSICFVARFLSEATIEMTLVSPTCGGYTDGALLAQPIAGKPPYAYQWEDGSSQARRDGIPAGTYRLTVTDSRDCVAEKTVELSEPESIVVSADYTEPSCFGGTDGAIQLGASGGTPDYTFQLAGETLPIEALAQQLAAGPYALLVYDANDCEMDTTLVLNQPRAIALDLPRDTSIALGCEWTINARVSSELPYTVQWTPVLGLDCGQCERPRLTATKDLTYRLEVVDQNDCRTSDSLRLTVLAAYELYIPNVFSPNFDGVNDYFEVFPGKAVEQIVSLRVFNRWGALVFQQENFAPGDPIGRWDGRFGSRDYDPGVYVYVAEVAFLDGAVERFSGDVTILK